MFQVFDDELRNQYNHLSEAQPLGGMNIISIGEILWDLFPNDPRIGGAPFNFAVHMHRLGHDVCFISAVGDDDLGRRALHQVSRYGLSAASIKVLPGQPTGTVDIDLKAGEPSFVINQPAAYGYIDVNGLPVDIEADWIYYGTLAQFSSTTRQALADVTAANPGAQLFYDANLRPDTWSVELVEDLLSIADIAKVNEWEAATIDVSTKERVCITRGERGCTLRFGSLSVEVPGVPTAVSDTVGAGDAWAAGFLHAYSRGLPLRRAGEFANRLGALVASRRGGVPEWSLGEL